MKNISIKSTEIIFNSKSYIMGINIRPDLETRSSLKVLCNVLQELLESLGVNNDVMDVIKKGILERQIIKKVIINYLDKDNLMIGFITIAIDWDKHQLLAMTENAEFEVDPKSSISEQISEIFPKLVSYTQNLYKHYNVNTIDTRYSYKEEILNNPEKLAEARECLGSSPKAHLKLSQNILINEIDFLDNRISYSSDFSNKPKTGAELVAYWRTVGVIDSRSDITDSQEYARKLRHEAETSRRI